MRGRLLLLIEPPELNFHVVEKGRPTSCTIRLTNSSIDHVAYKVKASDSKRFAATPHRRIIAPGSTCEVTVTRLEPPPNLRQRDRFIIESLVVDPDDNAESIQRQFSLQRDMVDVCELSLRVVYLDQQERNLNYIQVFDLCDHDVGAKGDQEEGLKTLHKTG